jgi:hypothetical protein
MYFRVVRKKKYERKELKNLMSVTLKEVKTYGYK